MTNNPFIIPKSKPIKVYQGADFEKLFQYGAKDESGVFSPIPLTGITFHGQVRDTYAGATALLNLTTANGGFVVVDNDQGIFKMVITAAATTAIDVPRVNEDGCTAIPYKDYIFEVEKIEAGLTRRFIAAPLRIYAEGVRT